MRVYGSSRGALAALFLTLLVSRALWVFGQSAPLLVVGRDTVTEGAFRYAYEKNRSYTLMEQLTLDAFLDSYRGFCLKVAEARRQRLDTLASVRQEYDRYVDFQLGTRLLDSAAREAQYRAAYDRMREEVSASHLLVRIPEGGDTLRAWNQVMELRARALEGADFGALAQAHSEDPSARQNRGYLGYFGAFTMVPAFEMAAYAQPVGRVSMPVRTTFGYHLILVHGRRPSRGRMRVAHIVKLVPPDADSSAWDRARAVLDSLRGLVSGGTPFAELAGRESEDKGSASNGGLLPWVTPERFPEEFVEACHGLRADGELSGVVRTRFGLHLIQRIRHEALAGYDEAKEQIRGHFARAGMILEGEHALRNALQRRAGFQLYRGALESHSGAWLSGGPVPDSVESLVLARWEGGRLTGGDLSGQLARVGPRDSLDQGTYFHVLSGMVDTMVRTAGIRLLCGAEPELGYLLREFRDGLLLFEISEREVWGAAMPDSLALSRTYARHRRALRFRNCLEVTRYHGADADTLARIREELLRGESVGDRAGVVSERFRCEGGEGATRGYGQAGREWSGDVSLVRAVKGAGDGTAHEVVWVRGRCGKAPKSFAEARAELYALHQQDLESAWVKRLEKRHRVWVNRARLRALRREYGR